MTPTIATTAPSEDPRIIPAKTQCKSIPKIHASILDLMPKKVIISSKIDQMTVPVVKT